jgi:hypothetical protein
MPQTRASRNVGKTINTDQDAGPSSAAAAEGRSIRSRAAAPEPAPTLAPKPASKPKPARRAVKGKEKTVTIEQTTRQIDGNANLAPDTQADYTRKFAFLARCLKENDMQKLINQPDRLIAYIRDRYTNLNSRNGLCCSMCFNH